MVNFPIKKNRNIFQKKKARKLLRNELFKNDTIHLFAIKHLIFISKENL